MSSLDNIQYKIVEDDSLLYEESSKNSPTLTSKPNNAPSIESQIEEYIKIYSPKLYILTPCFSSLCYVTYVNSLMKTIEYFRAINLPLQVEFCRNDSLVSRARNNLIARAMTDNKATHFLFIDNDITWEPYDILKLILADKDIIGGVYPLKNYEWSKLMKNPNNPFESDILGSIIKRKNASQLKDMITDEQMIQFNLLRYNINYKDTVLQIQNNIACVKHTATGFMLIKREVISNMQKAFPSTKYVDDVGFLNPHENINAYALFDCGVEEGHYFSEDWLFCDRWTKMGGKIFIDVTINLVHTGIEDYRGCYISTII